MNFWKYSTFYNIGDIVQYKGNLYMCLTANRFLYPDLHSLAWKRTPLTVP